MTYNFRAKGVVNAFLDIGPPPFPQRYRCNRRGRASTVPPALRAVPRQLHHRLIVLTVRALRSLFLQATWSTTMIAASISIITFAAIAALGRRLDGTSPALALALSRTSPEQLAR